MTGSFANHMSSMRRYIGTAVAVGIVAANLAFGADWKPAAGPLTTRWTADVTPENVHAEYPRPQMVRPDWLNLNGLWDYAIRPRSDARPESWDGQILVPFCVESALSGVKKPVGPDQRLWYRRTFEIPTGGRWSQERRRILLNFGAVDWETTVWVNGTQVGSHKGGYDSFTFEITEALTDSGPQEIVVSVWDPTDAGTQPRGKQVRRPSGIWYTAVTGIWQTVWIEPVGHVYVESLKLVPDIDEQVVRLTVNLAGGVPDPDQYPVSVQFGTLQVSEDTSLPVYRTVYDGKEVEIDVNDPNLWSPDSPYLYEMSIDVGQMTGTGPSPLVSSTTTSSYLPAGTDSVQTYYAMRKIEVKPDADGVNRLFLNNKPLFEFGPLDQGWWPDGLYTAPTDEALRYDIEVTKQLGFNMARKHVKVEPDRWYYWADKLGLLVWQDMPNGDRHIGRNDPDIERTPESGRQFETELKAMVEGLSNHPSIVMWVPFNEGWGQWDTAHIAGWVKELDPSRLVDSASGWTDRGVGDVNDVHSYPGPTMPPLSDDRAAVLGEFGGLGLPIADHTWQNRENWGYRSYTSGKALTDAYLALIANLRPLIGDGLAAAVYTQTSDVETEINGLMTYDRAVIKMDPNEVRAANESVYLPPPTINVIVPSSQVEGQAWRYTMTQPAQGWEQPDFDAAAWPIGLGGFGVEGTPGTTVRTNWNTDDIWIRRAFDVPNPDLAELYLLIHHDEDAEVYINGRSVGRLQGYTTNYVHVPIGPEAVASLHSGRNVLAIHCHQSEGGQYVDAGIVEIEQPK